MICWELRVGILKLRCSRRPDRTLCVEAHTVAGWVDLDLAWVATTADPAAVLRRVAGMGAIEFAMQQGGG